MSLAVVGAMVVAAWQSRQRILADTSRELRTLSLALSEQTARSLQAVDLALDVVQERARGAGALADSGTFAAWAVAQATHDAMADAARAVPQADVFLLIDAEGRLLTSSRFFPPPPRDLSDRQYFRQIRDGGATRVIGEPVINRGTDTWAFHIARRITGKDGAFLGVEVAAIELAYFQEIFQGLEAGRGVAVSLLRDDAVLLVRHPAVASAVGRQIRGDSPLYTIQTPVGVVLRMRSAIDGEDRLLISRRLPGFPLRVNVSFSSNAVAAEWKTAAGRAAAAGVVLLIVVWGAYVALRRSQIAQDLAIAEQIRAEEAATVSEERLRLALDAVNEGLWDWRLASDAIFCSDRWLTLLGYRRGEVPENPKAWSSLIHSDDLPRASQTLRAHLKGETSTFECEARMRHKDGHWRWMLVRGKAVMRDDAGRALRMVGTQQDITQRKLAEAALAAREAELRAVLDAVPECVCVIAQDGGVLSMNRAGLALLAAQAPEQVIGKTIEPLISNAYHETWVEQHRKVCSGQALAFDLECTALTGEYRTLQCLSVPLEVPDLGTAHLCVARDVTAQRAAEQDIRQLQIAAMKAARVSAMGAMAAGLAHELNQPLAAISNFSAAGRAIIKAGGHAPAFVNDVDEALAGTSEQALRAGAIVRRLREFIRSSELSRTSLRARAIVEEALEAAHRSSSPDDQWTLTSSVSADVGDVFGDPIQLQQVLANLIRNAHDATHGVASAHVVVGACRTEDGGGVEFRVSDNGPGVSPEISSRAFEVFQSTKTSGLGVGLTICRTIVEAHGGRIWVEDSEELGGACFRFTIPDLPALGAEGAE